jgi:hypothetical protein
MLIPVHERSAALFYSTDINGHRRQINRKSCARIVTVEEHEPQRNANDKTMFLVNEFGTGSDPG